jgi:hypothetical protein
MPDMMKWGLPWTLPLPWWDIVTNSAVVNPGVAVGCQEVLEADWVSLCFVPTGVTLTMGLTVDGFWVVSTGSASAGGTKIFPGCHVSKPHSKLYF